nr:pentatricopeptide repeat-containing protein At5g46580, chloroplastic [Ipomoea batatas]
MAAKLSTALDIHFTYPCSSETKHPYVFNSPSLTLPRKRLNIYCNNSSKSPPRTAEKPENRRNGSPSLSEQLKPLSTTVLADQPSQTKLLSKPQSTWVNPARPRPSVLSLQRQKRSSYSYNPQIRDLKRFARKLNEGYFDEEGFMAVLEEIPESPTKENALLVLNSLRDWQKSLLFLNWIKAKDLFPLETIFYNVAMKSLRFGRQFEHIERLAFEMVENGVELDNITYSTIITCAKRCGLFDKALEWFERMYKTGLIPDEVTYSAVLDVYAQLGKVEDAISLYERGRASGWTPDAVAFSMLARMFGSVADYDGIRFVLQEMKNVGVQPNLVVYNTLFEALGKAGKPGLARSLFEEMLEYGLTPNEKTLTCLIKIYGKARWARDALELWERMKSKGWPMDFYLYNTLLSMCADIGLEEEAERLFGDMKESRNCKPDSWSYTAMINIYASGGDVEKAVSLYKEMAEEGVELNVMGCTCLIQCLGKAKRIDDLVMVFEASMERGIKPDDRLCGCLLSVVSYCEGEDAEKVLGCLQRASPRLVAVVRMLGEESTSFDTVKEEIRVILSNTSPESRRPFCNCLIDICRNRNLQNRAHELLYLGTVYGLYPGLHSKTSQEWRLNVRSLSVGAARTAFEEWMATLAKIVQREEPLPQLFTAYTGAGTHRFSQGLANAFASHLETFEAPFKESEEKAGFFIATQEDLVSWIQSKAYSLDAATISA